MDILALVTLIALALAMSMVVITARLLREERRRSEARVAALTAAAAEDEVVRVPVRAAVHHASSSDPTLVRPRAAPGPVRADDLDLYPSPARDESRAVGAALFGRQAEPAASSSRLALVVAIGAGVVGAAVALVVWSSSRGTPVDTGAAAAVRSAHSSPASVASGPPALELVALRHRRDGDRLAVSGIIKNPSGARPVKNVSAVVFLFDQSGSFLSSGRAPVDFTTLAPGEESPFVVVVTEPGAVSRYRVSFRSDDHVVPHVDRRDPGTPAGGTSAPAVSRTRDAGGRLSERQVG